MSDATLDRLHPYQSTRDLDGIYIDREIVQDIAYDGDTCMRQHDLSRSGARFQRSALPQVHGRQCR